MSFSFPLLMWLPAPSHPFGEFIKLLYFNGKVQSPVQNGYTINSCLCVIMCSIPIQVGGGKAGGETARAERPLFTLEAQNRLITLSRSVRNLISFVSS